MASLIPNKEIASRYVRVSYINSESSLPDFDLAAQRYLVPVIGQDLYDDLVDQVTENNVTDSDLLEKCRAVIVPLAYALDLPTIQTQITDSGVRTVSNDSVQAAHRWEYNAVLEGLMDKGCFAIDNLLRFLFDNQDSYPLWTDSDEFEEMSELIFKSGYELRKYFTVYQPHRVYWDLRPILVEVKDFFISAQIGEVFLKELLEKKNPTDQEKEALSLVKKCTANYTITKAIEKLSVRMTPKGFTTLLSAGSSDAANAGDAEQKDNVLDLLHRSCLRDGDAYLSKLTQWLNTLASADMFATYFESTYYKAPGSDDKKSINAHKKNFLF